MLYVYEQLTSFVNLQTNNVFVLWDEPRVLFHYMICKASITCKAKCIPFYQHVIIYLLYVVATAVWTPVIFDGLWNNSVVGEGNLQLLIRTQNSS